jgi:type II secretory pathway pseudopilin PulG
MKNYEKGFKIIEFLVVLGILAILAIFFLPKFIKETICSRENEVKSNIHVIQIALERYAVDSGGLYPLFLIGAERDYNILRASLDYTGNGISKFPVDGMTPFAMALDGENGPKLEYTMDPLIQFGYINEYPRNPFTNYNKSINTSFITKDSSPGEFPYGGQFGDKMFDLGFGWGDTPQTDFVNNNFGEGMVIPDLDAPGNFYYHPIFDDSRPVYWHYAMQYGMLNLGMDLDSASNLGIYAHEPIGYFLHGYGSSNESGRIVQNTQFPIDFLYPMPDRENLPEESDLLLDQFNGHIMNSSIQVEGSHGEVEYTGYLNMEFDPWIEEFPEDREFKYPIESIDIQMEYPEEVNDWVIVTGTSLFGPGESVVMIEPSVFSGYHNDPEITSDQESTYTPEVEPMPF